MLCGEDRADVVDLLLGGVFTQRHEEVGCPKVAVVLGNLVLEYQVISKGVPGKLT